MSFFVASVLVACAGPSERTTPARPEAATLGGGRGSAPSPAPPPAGTQTPAAAAVPAPPATPPRGLAVTPHPIALAALPKGLPITGKVVDAYEWWDRRGHNLLVQTAVVGQRDRDGQVEITYNATHFVGDPTLKVLGEARMWDYCGAARMRHRASAPEFTDVDANGELEVSGRFDITCGHEASVNTYVLVGGVNLVGVERLIAKHEAGFGVMSASLRQTSFVPQLRARWPELARAIGLATPSTVAPAVVDARAAFSAAEVRSEVGGRVEEGLRWHDAAGDAAYVQTRRTVPGWDAQVVTGEVLRVRGSQWTQVVALSLGPDCDDDPEPDAAPIEPVATQLTDLDADGLLEIWFGGRVDCDLGTGVAWRAGEIRFMVVEGSDVYTLRGRTARREGDPPGALVFEDDPESSIDALRRRALDTRR